MVGAKVLYFHSLERGNMGYYELYKVLKAKFNGKSKLSLDQVDKFLFNLFGKTLWYLKETSYHIEIYDLESNYIFCINKPIK